MLSARLISVEESVQDKSWHRQEEDLFARLVASSVDSAADGVDDRAIGLTINNLS